MCFVACRSTSRLLWGPFVPGATCLLRLGYSTVIDAAFTGRTWVHRHVPNAHVSRKVYTVDRDRYTCSGGTSPVDMMLHFIKRQCGPEVSAGVAEQFIYERIRRSDDRQRVPLKHVVGNQSEKLVIAVELMEANIREPMSLRDIARYTDTSQRQLQRLFQRYLLVTRRVTTSRSDSHGRVSFCIKRA